MRYGSFFILIALTLFFATNIVYGLESISLPKSYEGTASLKVNGAYHSSIPGTENDETIHDYQETVEQNGKVNALLVGNYLIYMPAIEKPVVTGTISYNHQTYRNGKPFIFDTAPSQNITVQYYQGAIGLYINFAKKTYTLSMGLGAEGDSTHFDSITGEVESQTKKRLELEKVELTLPLPQDMRKLKGNKVISCEFKTPDIVCQIFKNKKAIEISWEFIASTELVKLPRNIKQ